MDMLKQGNREKTGESENGVYNGLHGVGRFTNNGHVNLMIVTVNDADQLSRLVREVLEQKPASPMAPG